MSTPLLTERGFICTAATWFRHLADNWELLRLDVEDSNRLAGMAAHCEALAHRPERVVISATVRTDLDPADVLDWFHTWLDEMCEEDAERCDTTAAKERCESLWEDAKNDASVERLDDSAPDPQPL